MADGGGTPIDSLEIKIEASSSKAAEQVTALTKAIEKLKSAVSGDFGSIVKNIKSIGEAAESAMPKSIQSRKQSLKEATSQKESSYSPKIEIEVPPQIQGLTNQLEVLETVSERVGEIEINGPEIDDSSIRDIEKVVDGTEKLSDAIDDLNTKTRVSGIGEKLVGGDEVKEIREAVTATGELSDSLDKVDKKKIEPEVNTKGLNDIKNMLDGLESKTVKIDLKGEDLDHIGEVKKQLEDLGYSIEKVNTSTKDGAISGASIFAKIADDAKSVKPATDSVKSEFDDLIKKLDAFRLIAPKSFGSIRPAIKNVRDILKGLKILAPDVYKSIQSALKNVTGGDAPKVSVEIEAPKDDSTQVVKERLETLKDTAQSVGGMKLDGPSISDSVTADVEKATQSYENLGDVIDKINIKGGGGFNDIGEELLDTSSVDSFIEAINEINNTRFNDIGERLLNPDQVEGMLNAIQNIGRATGEAIGGVKPFAETIGSIGSAAGGATASVEGVSSALSGLGAVAGSVVSALGPIALAIGAIVSVIGPIFVKGMKDVGSITGVVINKLKELASAIKNAIKQFSVDRIKDFGNAIKSIATTIKDRFTKPFETATKTVKQWISAIGRVSFYRAIRSAIKAVTDGFQTGIQNLYYYSQLVNTQFAPAMDSLATSALYLKNSLGAMAAPLIQALEPAIRKIIDLFVTLLNVIGKVFAALTGKKTYTQAVKTTKQWGDALDKAAGSAKEFRKYLMGIDELNIMQEPSDSGAGGGGADFGSMFEEVEVPNDILDWAADIKLAIDADDWVGVGKLLAEKLWDLIKDWDAYAWGKQLGELITKGLKIAYGFLTNFPWDQFGAKLADAINGLADGIEWQYLGATIGAGFNALFLTIYGFATKLEWGKIGSDIAMALNGFIHEINPELAATAISKFITGVFELANRAITETHWDVLGKKIADFLNGIDWYGIIYGALSLIGNAFEALKKGIDAFLARWDWKEQARQIYTAINDAFADVDWPGLGKSLGDFFITAFKFLRETIKGIEWKQIGKDIADFLLNINWVELLGGLTDLIAEAINAAIGLVRGFIDTMSPNLKEIAEGIAGKINDFFRTVNWDELGQTIHDGIIMAIEFLSTILDNLDFEDISNAVVEFLSNLDAGELASRWDEMIGKAIGFLTDIIDLDAVIDIGFDIAAGIFSGMLKKFNESGGITGWIKREFFDKLIEAFLGLFGIASPSTVMRDEVGVYIGAGVFEGIKKGLEGIGEFLSGFVEGLKQLILDPWGTIQSGLGMIWGAITGDAQQKWGQTRDEIGKSVDGTDTDVNTKWDKIRSDLDGKWGDIDTKASQKFGATREAIGKEWDQTGTETESKWSGIQSNLDTSWGLIQTHANEKFQGAKEKIAQAWADTSTDTDTKWQQISNILDDTWTGITNDSEVQFNETKGKIQEAWDATQTDTNESWTEIKGDLSDSWDEVDTTAETKFSAVSNTISGKFTDLIGKAKTWGSDIVKNIGAGIEAAKSGLSGIVSGIAGTIKSFLHFSEPDVGPLSDFHTYMPDMMKLMAKGINDNADLAVNAVESVASEMSNAFQGIAPEDLEFPVHEEVYSKITADVANANAQVSNDGSDNFGETMRGANGDVVSAILAAAAQIVNAVNESGDRPISLDIGKVAGAVTTTQNRNNKMYGKTIQNI